MIIFDLDGTLADCEHRRHFVEDPCDRCNSCYNALKIGQVDQDYQCFECKRYTGVWLKPDYKSFYEACDKDELIYQSAVCFMTLQEKFGTEHPIQIWSGRCESVREKTIEWLHLYFSRDIDWNRNLKMRPIGDSTPDDQLKEKWLDEALSQGKKIDFVFDDRPKVVRMWHRRGVFVFNCLQHDMEF